MEVRYEMMRRDEMVARREERPVANLGIGILEWHGDHDALGLVDVKANGIVTECARQGGGIVSPPLFQGENRTEAPSVSTDGHPFDRTSIRAKNPGCSVSAAGSLQKG